jgi:hypothetical protein
LGKGLREGFFRIAFVSWALGSAVGVFFAFADLGSQRGDYLVQDLASTVTAIAIWSALTWGTYGTAVWIAAGFTGGQPPRGRHAAAVAALTVLTFFASEIAERRAQNRLREHAEAQNVAARRAAEAEQAAAAQEQQRRDEFNSRRVPEILAAYPAAAENLDHDTVWGDPSPFGKSDPERKNPQTGGEYLTSCASRWVRRKCAVKLAEAEFSHGPLFDAESSAKQQSVSKTQRAKESSRMRARLLRAEQSAAERAQAQQQAAAEKAQLMDRYRGSGLLQEWCVTNQGVVFGPENPVQADMQKQCEAIRAQNEHAGQ